MTFYSYMIYSIYIVKYIIKTKSLLVRMLCRIQSKREIKEANKKRKCQPIGSALVVVTIYIVSDSQLINIYLFEE